MNLKELIKSKDILNEKDLDKILNFIQILKSHTSIYFEAKGGQASPKDSKISKGRNFEYDNKTFFEELNRMIGIVEESSKDDMEKRIALADSIANIMYILRQVDEIDNLDYLNFEEDIYIELFVLFRAYDDIF